MMSANSLAVNLAVTFMVAALVVLLPVIDMAVCRRLGVDPRHENGLKEKEQRRLRLRRAIIWGLFAFYAAANAYLVFFSRNASADYLVHIDLMADLGKAISIDTGVFGILKDIFEQGFEKGFSHIHINSPANIAQVYMNVMLYVPMGYLLPYAFSWFRAKPKVRPVACGVLMSFLTENIQLVTKRGFYDLDDLVSNSVGALIGQLLFLSMAYTVTHPNWRKELAQYRRWRKNARKRTLYPYIKKIGTARTTIQATDECAVWDFYVDKLGFRVIRQLVWPDRIDTAFLLQMGGVQLEICCSNTEENKALQELTFRVGRFARVRRRLEQNGIHIEASGQDPYTGANRFSFTGPDNVKITIME